MEKRFLVIFSLVLAVSTARAEKVDLAAALSEAVANRPFARAACEEAQAARAAVAEARSRLLPRLTLSENLLWTDEPGGSLFISLNQQDLQLSPDAGPYNHPPSRRDFETRLTLEQALFDPDRIYDRKRAQAGAEAAEAAARWSAEQAGFAAFGAYLELQRASAALDWAESSHGLALEVLRLAQERHQAGTGLKSDALGAAVALSEAKQRLQSAKNDERIARSALALALGREPSEVELGQRVGPEMLADEAAAAEPMQRADLEALELQGEQARLASRQARADYLPRAGVAASYGLHDGSVPFGAEAGSWRVTAGLSWELFDGLRRSGATERTRAQERSARLQSLEASRQAAFELQQARARATEAALNLETARQATLEAEESSRLLQERYGAGLSELSELLAARSSLDRARYGVVEGEARLLLALGTIRYKSGTFLKSLLPVKENQP